jgi:Transglycosylase SLT domain
MKHLICLLVTFCLLGASQALGASRSAPELGASQSEEGPTTERLEEAALSLSYAKSAKADTDRLKSIMADTYAFAEGLASTGKQTERLLFEGNAAREAHAILLYSVMYNESGMRPHIERCDCTHGDGDCDQDEAAGLPQIHKDHFRGHTKEEVCADRKLQIELASAVLAEKKTNCGSFPLTLGAYNAGGCVIPAPTIEGRPGYVERASRVFQILLRKAKINVRQQGRKWVATAR